MSASLSTSSPISVTMCLLTIFHWGRWNPFLKIAPQQHRSRLADGARILPAVRKSGLMKVKSRIMSRSYLLLWSREFWRSIRSRIPILACVISLRSHAKLGLIVWSRNLTLRGQEQHSWLRIAPWIWSLLSCMNLPTKLWPMTFFLLLKGKNTRLSFLKF